MKETSNVAPYQMSSGNWGRAINNASAIFVPSEPAIWVLKGKDGILQPLPSFLSHVRRKNNGRKHFGMMKVLFNVY